MKLRELLLEELEDLEPTELLRVYNYVLELKDGTKDKCHSDASKGKKPYLRAREALSKCEGSLAEDIIRQREDRI